MADFQTDGRLEKEMQVGQEGQAVAMFRRKSFLVQNLEGTVEGLKYEMKLPAPWSGLRYRLEQDGNELASASRPKIAKRIAEFELELPGRSLQLIAEDRHGLRYNLLEGGAECGSITQRPFEEQNEWEADSQAPAGWSVPLAAFVAWLAREGRKAVDR